FRMNSTRRHGDYSRAKMPGAGDVVRGITNHDELSGLELSAQIFIDSSRCRRGQVTTIERFIAERARQGKEFCQARDFYFEVRGRFNVAGQQRRRVARMFGDRL